METGFRGILAVRTKLIPKRLARWFLEKYDPWDCSLKLPNCKLLIDEEYVYATLGLTMGQLKISEGQSSQSDIEFLELWSRRWNAKRSGPPIRSMHKDILEHGGHGHKFITDLITYAVSICIIRNGNGTCHFRAVKYLRNVNEIQKYKWCAYAIKCLNEALFHLDRVQLRRSQVESLVVINSDTEKVRNRDGDKQLLGEYERGRIIERIDYQNITRLAEAYLELYNYKKANLNKEDLVRCLRQLQLESNDVHTTHIAMDHVKMSYVSLMIQRSDTTYRNANVTKCLSLHNTYYCSLEFLELVNQLESMAREQM
ncbi:LOW QUALITY PROTEIN: hypothetical protein Cgig2_025684 [Carnegiea gigantea]|uniref:Uncharacterized protein n=1 Tax=Carnegiea gigantea TaxID=171969 RepID=A0A9Q1JU15_9CARY|nr:LOW QUALITY PROTEIN: hypothetical protein Cgig2_025684 [Carnegiea gigantea]